jgi:hypothetical protein
MPDRSLKACACMLFSTAYQMGLMWPLHPRRELKSPGPIESHICKANSYMRRSAVTRRQFRGQQSVVCRLDRHPAHRRDPDVGRDVERIVWVDRHGVLPYQNAGSEVRNGTFYFIVAR